MLRIVGSRIDVGVFNIGSICTNLKCCWLGEDKFESIYKNWPNDARLGGFPSVNKDEHVNGLTLIEMEETLMDKNGHVIASLKLLDLKHGNNRL